MIGLVFEYRRRYFRDNKNFLTKFYPLQKIRICSIRVVVRILQEN